MSEHIKIASRYAVALFDTAKEAKKTESITKELESLLLLIKESADFQFFLANPSFARAQQIAVIEDIAKQYKLSSQTMNMMKIAVENRRLPLLKLIATMTLEKLADDRGEITAQVISAKKLTAKQENQVVETIEKATGKNIFIKTIVDKSIIGGLIVQCGSLMIDNSVKTKIETMKRQMKGAA